MRKQLLSLMIAALPTFALGQFTSNNQLNTVLRDSSGVEEAVPIAAGISNGSTVVTYFNQTGTNPYDFSMQTVDKNGQYVISPSGLTISSYPQNTAIYKYDMKANAEGEIVAAFQDERSGSLDIVAYRMSANGNFIWGTAGVSLTDTGAAGGLAPAVGVLPNGKSIVAWVADGSPKDWVAFQSIEGNGSLTWNAVQRIKDPANAVTYSRPQVIPTSGSDFLLFYIKQSGNFFPPVSTMFMQRFDQNAQPVWAQAVQLSTKTIGFADYPSVIPDGNDGAYIAFATGNPALPSFNDVYVQHIDSSGNLWSTDGTEAISGTATQRMSPKIRFENGMANPVVVMKETDGGQSSAGVSIQSFDPLTGNVLLGPTGVSVTTINSLYDEPYDMRAICGKLIILYAEGGFGNNLMYAIEVDQSGIPQWSPASVLISNVASNKSRGQLTPAFTESGTSQVVAVWEDERAGRGIYAQNIGCDGSLGQQFTNSIFAAEKERLNASIFPNPGTEQYLKISASSQGDVTIKITDSYGRCVWGKEVTLLTNNAQFSIPELNKLSPGMYWITITNASDRSVSRFIKQ